jgi:endonuclease/exonuclease/phosphatase family metal-dependent hydrolase
MRSSLLLLICLLHALPVSASSWRSQDREPVPRPVLPELRVKTYNLNFGLEGDPSTTQAIGAGEPDVVLLQETTPGWEAAILEVYRGEYEHIAFIDGPGAGGQGLLSRFPVVRQEVLPSPIGWFPGWLLVVETPRGPLQILSLHLKPPWADRGGFVVGAFTTGDDRLEELDVYLSFVDPALPTLVLGDFNEQRGPSLSLLEDQGFSDALPQGEDTWRWTVAGFELDAALDHVFHGPELIPVQVEVQDLGRSDHLPVLVGFVVE